MDTIENIKNLWSKIDYKTGFITAASKEFKRSEGTLHTHWFARWFSVPKDEQENVVKFMQNYIKNQNNVA